MQDHLKMDCQLNSICEYFEKCEPGQRARWGVLLHLPIQRRQGDLVIKNKNKNNKKIYTRIQSIDKILVYTIIIINLLKIYSSKYAQ